MSSKNGRPIHTLRGGLGINNLTWSPLRHIFTYTQAENDKTTLWAVDLESGTSVALVQNISGFKSYRWSPDSKFIVYSITEKAEEIVQSQVEDDPKQDADAGR